MVVPSGPDCVVVFGSSTDSVAGADAERAVELAVRANTLVRDVSPAKRLADEFEVLAAVREVTTIQAESVTDTLATIAARARAALSAEFAAIGTIPSSTVDGAIGWSAGEWAPLNLDAPARALARFAARPERLPLLCQDVAEMADAPKGFRHSDGVSSMHVLPIGEPAIAIMLTVHAEPALRGFTSLCQRVARGMSDAAEPVVRRAIAQERLREENARLALKLRTDALTGVASRSAWEEALRAVELEHARTRAPFSVVVIDLDGLKALNDAAGHAAGDELLRRAARLLASSVRSGDLVARIGGDEFGVLLRSVDSNQVVGWCDRLDERIRGSGETPLTWSLGAASVPPRLTIADAVAEADRRMYERKLERQVGRG
jgi:diguanylate cyclase (GGDEF)-like protein